MQTGARVLMYVALGTSALLLILIAINRPVDSRPILYGALHGVNFGATMMVAVGALHGHRAILGSVHSMQTQMARYDTRIEDQLQLLDQQIRRLQEVEAGILSAAADDLDARRHGGRRN